jgi:hypothetical protein
MLLFGTALYLGNFAMGLLAQLGGRRFGIWHHVAYAIVFASAIGAAVLSWHPALLLTLAALAVFPKARPRTVWHPTLALLGLLGYLGALLGS